MKKTLPSDRIYFKSSGPKVQQIRLGPYQTPTAEHLGHRIGYVLESFPAHRFGDYATELGQVLVSRVTGKVPPSTHLDDYPVYQKFGLSLPNCPAAAKVADTHE